jgi:hypothetical protein
MSKVIISIKIVFCHHTRRFNFLPFFRAYSSKTKLDPYLILDINRQADWKTIKKAYFRLARLYHPDLNKNDEVKFSLRS